jgi:hypothetical protein
MNLYLSPRRGDRRRRVARAVRVTKTAKSVKMGLPLATDPVVVTVLDATGQVGALRAHLPADWEIRPLSDMGFIAEVDLLVLGNATGPAVARARRLHPYAGIIAVIDLAAPVEVIVDVLGAGADACVRSGSTAILAGHLRACHRRRRAGGLEPRVAAHAATP